MSRLSILDRLKQMNQRSLFAPARRDVSLLTSVLNEPASADTNPAGQLRTEAVQRLQVGLFGIGAMLLLVGLASIIGSQADLAEKEAVPEAAPTTEPMLVPSQANPLADAGVVPDIAAQPAPSPAPSSAPNPLDLPQPPQASGSGNAAQ